MIRIVRYENDCTFNNYLSDYDLPNYEEQKKAMSQVIKMKRWLRILLIFTPKLRKVGNPMALLNHVSDYTIRELNLTNEINGSKELMQIKNDVSKNFSM